MFRDVDNTSFRQDFTSLLSTRASAPILRTQGRGFFLV